MSDFFATQDRIRDFEPAFGDDLFRRSLLIVGLGGNGTHLALAAVRMGFREVVGIDCDVVSESNLSRQVLYHRGDIGRRKAEAAFEALRWHNLRSEVTTHDFDILGDRRRFGGLVAGSDLVFLVMDQPGPTFFAVDACYRHGKPAVGGGTCVLSGLSARVAWMVPGQGACLNCAAPPPPGAAEWLRFYRYDGGEPKSPSPGVDEVDARINLADGHPSTYPAACLGANLMMAAAVNLLMGRYDIPRRVELAIPGLGLDREEPGRRADCPTCGAG